MAPREAGARYAADFVLSSVARRRHGKRRVDAAQRARAPEELECHIDRRRDGGARHGDTQRLRDLPETTLQLRGEIVEDGVNRRRAPLWHLLKLLTHSDECFAAV